MMVLLVSFSFSLVRICCYMICLIWLSGESGTIAKGAALLHEEGAREVYACCTHAVFRYCLQLCLIF